MQILFLKKSFFFKKKLGQARLCGHEAETQNIYFSGYSISAHESKMQSGFLWTPIYGAITEHCFTQSPVLQNVNLQKLDVLKIDCFVHRMYLLAFLSAIKIRAEEK